MGSKSKVAIKDIALVGMMVAIIEVCKVALAWAPNIELTSFWIIMFTLFFGKRILYVIPVFILIEGTIYGIHLWWIMYLYAWPILAFVTWLLRKKDSIFTYSMLSGIFGLFFGFLCALPYVVIGAADGGIMNGLYAGFTWWVAGIPWDIVHCVGNFVIMLVLYTPVKGIMLKTRNLILE